MPISFTGKVVQMPWNLRHSFFNMPKFANKQLFKSQFRQQYKRSFHSHSDYKRPNLSKSKWNVFDELKLFSYTSHLAFFMLLPPIIQMYTTKVEVTRDDTLTESSFASLDSNNGLIIKNMNFLDIIQSEKNKLLNMYLNHDSNISSESVHKNDSTIVSEFQNKSPIKPVNTLNTTTTISNPTNDNINRGSPHPRLDEQIKLLESAYSSLRNNTINDTQYISRIESITDDLIGLSQITKDDDAINNTIMKVFDQLHHLRLHNFEIVLFRRLLTSYKQPEIKFLNIRQKIIKNYEIQKKLKSNKKSKSNSNSKYKIIESVDLDVTPLKKLMNVSIWLRSYVKNFERFAQLVHMFAATNQQRDVFRSLFYLGFESSDFCKQIQNPEQRYGLISTLRGFNKEKEAIFLERKMRNLVSN